MKFSSLSFLPQCARLATIALAALALATPAWSGTLTVTSGPTFSPASAFSNNSIVVQTSHGAAGDLVRESGNATITFPDTGAGVSIRFNGNFSANAGDLVSVAYGFTADSNDTRSFDYSVTGTATISGIPQTFTSEGTITPGVHQYSGQGMAPAPFPAATTGTFSGTLSIIPITILPRPSGTSSAAPGTMNISIAQGDFQLAPTAAVQAGPPQLANISSRAQIMGGAQDAIAGFIITGSTPKRVIVRGLGPSLPSFVPTKLGDPSLNLIQLVGGNAVTIGTNNDWKSDQQVEIQATGLAPTNDLESAIVATLAPGTYTSQLSGNGSSGGIGLIEVYDLTPASGIVVNLSTRAMVETGDDVLIGGIIIGGAGNSNIVVRAMGPSMSQQIQGSLADPNLSLHDGNGTMIAFNDDWQQDANATQVSTSGLAPVNSKESALYRTLAPGQYTAVVRGANSASGIGLVEFYVVQTAN